MLGFVPHPNLPCWNAQKWSVTFVPGYINGQSVLGANVSTYVTDAHGYNTNNNVSAWDMAVMRLAQPLGNYYGYFGYRTYSSDWEDGNYWTLAGYPGIVRGVSVNGEIPTRQMWFPVLDDDSDGNALEVEYEADATNGNSGGPVFGFWPNEPWPRVIGTHSGGSRTEGPFGIVLEDTNLAAGGNAHSDLIAWARSNWPL